MDILALLACGEPLLPAATLRSQQSRQRSNSQRSQTVNHSRRTRWRRRCAPVLAQRGFLLPAAGCLLPRYGLSPTSQGAPADRGR